jgi:hypothetical protein
MHISGNMLEAEVRKEAEDKKSGVRRLISMAAQKRKAKKAAAK